MPQSPLRLIRKCAEYIPQEHVLKVPGGVRGVYVLYRRARNRRSKNDNYNVVYVGMGGLGEHGGIRSRLRRHRRTKRGLWTHFSLFVVWDNIRDEEIRELEGLFRHIYRRDSQASALNKARSFRALRKLRDNRIAAWPRQAKLGRR
jgi:hypothetical protein